MGRRLVLFYAVFGMLVGFFAAGLWRKQFEFIDQGRHQPPLPRRQPSSKAKR